MSISDQLKPHFDILDRYQAFAAELSRLSALGVSAVAYIIASATGELKNGAVRFISLDSIGARIAILSAISFIISAALALLYRYFSTESMTSMVRVITLESQKSRDQMILDAKRFRNRRFKQSFFFLVGSSSALTFGAVFLIMCVVHAVKL